MPMLNRLANGGDEENSLIAKEHDFRDNENFNFYGYVLLQWMVLFV